MKKTWFIGFIIVISIFCSVSIFAQANKATEVKYDFTKMNYYMTYAVLTDMVTNYEKYENVGVKIKGQLYTNLNNDQRYFFLMIWDPTGCCPSGIEFVPQKDSPFWESFPELYSYITVTGNLIKPEGEKTLVIKATRIDYKK